VRVPVALENAIGNPPALGYTSADMSRTSLLGLAAAVLLSPSHNLLAQESSAPAQKQRPAALLQQPFLVFDSVVTEQWPAMPPSVSFPTEPTVLNPGQCVRVGVAATGTGFEHFLDGVRIHAVITSGGKHEEFELQPSIATKLVRPDGANFVDDALAAGGLKNPLAVTGVLAVSAAKWCVPLDARDGSATFSADVDLHSKHFALKTQTVRVESLATAAAASFANKEQLGDWTMSYDSHPEPGRLLAAVRFFGAQDQPDLNGIQFLISAFGHDPAVASQFGPAISQFDKRTRLLAVAIATKANVALVHPPILNRDEQDLVKAMQDSADPYNISSSPQPWQNLDLLWAEFLATGNKKPVAAIAQTLAWKSDFDAFLTMQKEGKKPTELTPQLAHALTYRAAQWSLGSFYNNDPIAADYIRALRDDPSTPQAVRDGLRDLNAPHSPSAGQ